MPAVGPVQLRDLETGRRRLVDTSDPRFQHALRRRRRGHRPRARRHAGPRRRAPRDRRDRPRLGAAARALARPAPRPPPDRARVSFQQPLFLLRAARGAAGRWPLVVWWRRRRPVAGVPFPDLDVIAAADPGPRLRRHLPLVLALLALTGLRASPWPGPRSYRDEPRERATIMLAIDVSGSMAATDVDPVPAARRAGRRPHASPTRCPASTRWASSASPARRTCWWRRPPTATRCSRAIESARARRRDRGRRGDRRRRSTRSAPPQPGSAGDGTLEAARIVVLSDGATTVGRRRRQWRPRTPRRPACRSTPSRWAPTDGVLSNGQPVPPDPEGLQRDRRDHRRRRPTRATTPTR